MDQKKKKVRLRQQKRKEMKDWIRNNLNREQKNTIELRVDIFEGN